jgi:hypothetical protein
MVAQKMVLRGKKDLAKSLTFVVAVMNARKNLPSP